MVVFHIHAKHSVGMATQPAHLDNEDVLEGLDVGYLGS
jgi:hypothetical protein